MNTELMEQIESQNETIMRKIAEYEELRSEIDQTKFEIEKYVKEFETRLRDQAASWNKKVQEKESEKTSLVCEIEKYH